MNIYPYLRRMKKDAADPVTPYGNDASKKEQVTTMFDKIAPYYDFLNRFLSLGIDTIWRKKAVSLLTQYGPKTVLDVATGTGDLALEAHRQWKPDKITGIDVSKGMVDVGNKKLEKKRLSEVITLQIGDSENMAFDGHSFDVVMAAFGVRNFGNLEAGLSEMFRVLKTNGHLLILEFSRPRTFPIKNIFNAYFKYLLPVIGRIKSKDPKAYSYLYESVQSFPDYDDFARILRSTGFSRVEYKPLSFGICTIYIATK